MSNQIIRTLALILAISPIAIVRSHDHGHDHQPQQSVFIRNNGQWHNAVRYKADVRGATVFLENSSLLYTKLEDRATQVMHDASEMSLEERNAIRFNGHSWRMRFLAPSPEMRLEANGEAPFYHSYFLGSDRSKWAGKVPLFEEVSYSSVWPGVDMVLRSHEGHLKYDLVVAPNADVTAIGLAYDGLDEMNIDADGNLVLKTSVGELVELAPTVFYGDGDGGAIACRYVLDGNELRFAFPEGYNKSRRVIIDPVLIAGTYSGATGASNYGHCAAYDDSGNIYTGARNFGPTYPATVGAFQTSFGGGYTDISVSKFNPNGSQLIWAAYLGGSGEENPHSLIANSANELIVLGSTLSSDFPITAGAFDQTLDQQDITVTRISDDGTALLGSTFVGGSGSDGTNNIFGNYGEAYRGEVFLDQAENIVVVSFTSSSNFPVSDDAYQSSLGGAQDGVVFKMDPNCSTLIASTYLGGSSNDAAMGVRISDLGDVVVTGITESSDHPATTDSYQPTYQGGTDGYVARFSPDLSTLQAATFFGTSSTDRSYFVDLDSQGDVWIYGQTTGTIPIQPAGIYGTAGGPIFVAKLAADLSQALITTTIGSGGGTTPVAFLVDVCDQVFICGYNTNGQFPLTADALYQSGSFYLAVFDLGMQDVNFGTYYGGSHVDGGTSRFDKNGMVYQGVCSGGNSMQTASWAYAPSNQVSWDIGVFKIDMEQSGVQVQIQTDETQGCIPATFTFNGTGNSPVYIWDPGDGSPTVVGQTLTHTFTEVGTYVVTLVGLDSATCNISDTTMITVLIGDAEDPMASFEAEPISTCTGYGAQFTNTSTPTSDLVWDLGDGSTSTQSNPLHDYSAPGTYEVWLTISDDVCGGMDSVMVEVDIPPATMDYEIDSPVYLCDGATILLDAGGGYDSYAWSDGSNAQMISVNEVGEYSVSVSEGFCTGSDVVEVLLAPEMEKIEDEFGCPGLGTELNIPFEATNVNWNTGEDTTSITVTQTGTYWYSATDPYGCTVLDTVYVHVIPEEEARAKIPNVFSPNNDGENDTFLVDGIALQEFDMEVYNRWGQLVFASQNPVTGWNGGLNNSTDKTPEGTYYYVIKFRDVCSQRSTTTYQGHVTLLR